MTTGLERIATKAREDKKLRFTSLAHHITPALLSQCLMAMANNSGTGVDQMTVSQAKESIQQWAPEIIDSMYRQGYRPPPVRRVYIPKPGKQEKRPLGVPSVTDRCLQGAVAKVLGALYEQDFLDCSMGGRKGCSAHQAVATFCKATASRKVNWVYEADLKNFFGSLDHGWVERFVSERVGDPRIMSLIKRWLKAGIIEEGQWYSTEQGTPQGGPISVLISNIYLHYVLDLWIEKVVKPRMAGEVYYIRYVDDFVLCFQYKTDAQRFEKALVKRLSKFALSLEPSKTRLVAFGRFAQENALAQGEKPETIYFLGFTFFCSKTKNGRFKVGMKTEKSRLRRGFLTLKGLLREIRHLPLSTQIRRINSFLTGHFNYYGIAGNFAALRGIHYFAEKYWRKMLSSRSQKGKVSWEKYRRLLRYFKIRAPKVRLSYSHLNAMALL